MTGNYWSTESPAQKARFMTKNSTESPVMRDWVVQKARLCGNCTECERGPVLLDMYIFAERKNRRNHTFLFTIFTHLCTSVRMNVCVYTYRGVRVYKYSYIHTYMHTWVSYLITEGYIHTYIHTHIPVYTYIHTYIHTYIQIFTHAHMGIRVKIILYIYIHIYTYMKATPGYSR